MQCVAVSEKKHAPLICPGSHNLTLPDVKAAEDGEEEAGDNRCRNGQKHCHYPVDPNSRHLIQGVTPDPHSVPAAH